MTLPGMKFEDVLAVIADDILSDESARFLREHDIVSLSNYSKRLHRSHYVSVDYNISTISANIFIHTQSRFEKDETYVDENETHWFPLTLQVKVNFSTSGAKDPSTLIAEIEQLTQVAAVAVRLNERFGTMKIWEVLSTKEQRADDEQKRLKIARQNAMYETMKDKVGRMQVGAARRIFVEKEKVGTLSDTLFHVGKKTFYVSTVDHESVTVRRGTDSTAKHR